ncbi:MAG: type IV secretory system conjugative DNA transfer family protein [Ruminococcus sp.]|uniref:VirD4-like conjugal transfer protein, CD1115 family n=1 Tax=Ruminococcus sp. TaxID=41978 RepID=UPI0028733E81|nr:type IV secretory system conjugative DNA transfer family protein [Ruminococcus sp.]MBQ3285739.1 type IV secretory system conjugative DNA transfer family protein [Ruminococcus sp.]
MNNNRIFAIGEEVSNNTRATHLNNNDMIIGPTGAGKTTGYVLPNLLRMNGSCIVADTKGNLKRKTQDYLKKKGYKIHCIDFIDLRRSDAYNPLDYIRRDRDGRISEQDVTSVAKSIVPAMSSEEPFWEMAAQTLLTALIAYVLEACPEEEQNLISVIKIFNNFEGMKGRKLFTALYGKNPDSLAYRRYEMMNGVVQAERTWNCIRQFLTEALELFDVREAHRVFCGKSSFRFSDLGEEKSVLFLNISDVDRAFDRVIGLMYTQLFQELCRQADNSPGDRLKVPVRIILDDFSTNFKIPDFDKTLSVIRSREISATLILQSLTQLVDMYGRAKSDTIINNCDHILYLGGQDMTTAEYIANRANVSPFTVLSMPLQAAYLLERGRSARSVKKIPPTYSNEMLGIEEVSNPDPGFATQIAV